METFILVACCLTVALLLGFKHRLENKALLEFYKSQPASGIKDQSFAWLRAMLRSVFDTPDRVAEGYEKVRGTKRSSAGKMLTQRPVLQVESSVPNA